MGPTASSTADMESAKPEGERFGAYVLLDRIGKGGMGEVYRARLERGPDFCKLVALKRVLHDLADQSEFRARFLEEARTVASLQHPNVVQVFDFGEVDQRPYIVMELVDGVDLWRLMELSRRLGRSIDLPASIYVIAEAARGLGYAHAAERDGVPAGIVHRDVSPQNILISRLGEVKVADFGIAKATNDAFGRACKTSAHAVMGKLRYMAPEQVEGVGLDARTDVFALGVVLHELLSSVPLIDAVSPAGVIEQVKAARFEPPSSFNPHVPALLDKIAMRALAHDPGDRYPCAKDMACALGILLNQLRPGYGREELSEYLVRLLAELDLDGAAVDPLPTSRDRSTTNAGFTARGTTLEIVTADLLDAGDGGGNAAGADGVPPPDRD